jgi:hypothetical protein
MPILDSLFVVMEERSGRFHSERWLLLLGEDLCLFQEVARCALHLHKVGQGLGQVVSGVIRWNEVMNESVGDVPCR